MRLHFKQRFFSWFDSYDIYDEAGNTVYTVEGQLSWGHCLHILDAAGNHVGTVQERVFTLLPKFELYQGGEYIGCIQKEFSFSAPGLTSTASAGRWRGASGSGTTPSGSPAAPWWRLSPRSF